MEDAQRAALGAASGTTESLSTPTVGSTLQVPTATVPAATSTTGIIGSEGGVVAPAASPIIDVAASADGGSGGGVGGAGMKGGAGTREGEEAKDRGSKSAKRPRENPPIGLPKSMVRRIMKLGEDTRNISNEALVIVVKASEVFLEKFAARAFSHAEKVGRRTIKYQDVSDVRQEDPNLLFLEAVVPP